MSTINDLQVTKNEKETILLRVFTDYLSRFFTSDLGKKEFQKELLEIAQWDNDTQMEELEEFLTWARRKKKFDPSELFESVMQCYSALLGTTQKVSLVKFFYKATRSIARHYYKNIRKWAETGPEKPVLSELLQFTLHSMLPVYSVHTVNEVFYDFDTHMSYTCSISSDHVPLIVEKNSQSDDKLEYLSSDGFVSHNPQQNVKVNYDDTKEIKLVKLKKGLTNRPGPVVDEINEPFFSD